MSELLAAEMTPIEKINIILLGYATEIDISPLMCRFAICMAHRSEFILLPTGVVETF